MKTTTILVPIDFTPVAKNTVDYVIGLSKKLKTKIIFVHAYTIAYPSSTPIGMGTMAAPISGTQESQEKLNKQKLREYLESFPQLKYIEYKSYVGFGAIVDIICQTANDESVDAIIMGTEGADSSIEEIFVGTVSEKVSRKAACPVWIVPENVKYSNIEHIGLALDEDSLKNKVDIDLLVKIMGTFNCNLHLVQITNDEDIPIKENEVHLYYKNFLGEREYTFNVFKNNDLEEGIDQFLSEKPIDVLALLYREKGFFERLLEKGLRRKLVFDSNNPILVLK